MIVTFSNSCTGVSVQVQVEDDGTVWPKDFNKAIKATTCEDRGHACNETRTVVGEDGEEYGISIAPPRVWKRTLRHGPAKQFPLRIDLRCNEADWKMLEGLVANSPTREDRSEVLRRLIREAFENICQV